MSPPMQPTAELLGTVVAYLRAGGFPEVAAQAAGLPPEIFAEWMERGAAPDAAKEYREFRATILRTQAQVRLVVEAEVRQKRPLDWLRCGPGKSRSLGESWTTPTRASASREVKSPEPLLLAELQAAIGHLLEVLTPYPELREQLADLLEQSPP